MIRVLMAGGSGKTGSVVLNGLRDAEDIEVVGEFKRGESLAARIQSSGAQVLVDFTHPSCVLEHTLAAIEASVYPVIGTTGLTQLDMSRISRACRERRQGAVVAPNFSLGAVLMMRFGREAARWMESVEIVEMHRPEKVDSPSGTARLSASLMEEVREEEGLSHGLIPIHSIRIPGLFARQEILFGMDGQTLSLRHDVSSPTSFVPGVLLAIRKVREAKELIVGLEPLLFGDDDWDDEA